MPPLIMAVLAVPGATGDQIVMQGLAGDLRSIQATAALACGDSPPDLILMEIAIPDPIQHRFGYESAEAHWSIATADALVGSLVHRLFLAGRLTDTTVVVTSDHGHSPIDTAIHPDVVIPDALWENEGSTLHVALTNGASQPETAGRLAELGVEPFDNGYVPNDQRSRIATFVAPPRHSFESRRPESPADRPTGPPLYISSHGLKPGSPEDDRFCVVAPPGASSATVARATAEDLAPTFAALLGIPMPTAQGRPIAEALDLSHGGSWARGAPMVRFYPLVPHGRLTGILPLAVQNQRGAGQPASEEAGWFVQYIDIVEINWLGQGRI